MTTSVPSSVPSSVPPVAVAGHGPDAPPILTITVDVPGRVLGVTGELDLNGQRALADAVSILTEVYAPADIVVDLSGVVFMDICGLNALEALRRSQHQVGASLFLVGVPASVMELYEVAGLEFRTSSSTARA